MLGQARRLHGCNVRGRKRARSERHVHVTSRHLGSPLCFGSSRHGASSREDFLAVAPRHACVSPSPCLHHRRQVHVQRQQILSGANPHGMARYPLPRFSTQSYPLANLSKHRRYNLRRQRTILRLFGLFGVIAATEIRKFFPQSPGTGTAIAHRHAALGAIRPV